MQEIDREMFPQDITYNTNIPTPESFLGRKLGKFSAYILLHPVGYTQKTFQVFCVYPTAPPSTAEGAADPYLPYWESPTWNSL